MTHSIIQKLVFTAIFAGTVAAFVRSDAGAPAADSGVTVASIVTDAPLATVTQVSSIR